MGETADDTWTILASAGDGVPSRPEDADVVVPLHGTEVLVLSGEALGDDDRACRPPWCQSRHGYQVA